VILTNSLFLLINLGSNPSWVIQGVALECWM